MTNRTWRRSCSGVLCLAALALVGCSAARNDGSGAPTGPPKRIVFLTNGDATFWDSMRRGVEQASEDLDLAAEGLSAEVDKGDFSDEAQINKLKQYASQSDVAAVAISPVDAQSRGIADAMRELRAKGVRVICVDSDMDRSEYRDTRFAYLGTDNVVGGRELGKAARALLPEGGTYATFVGLKTVANAVERIDGFAEGAGEGFESLDSLGDNGLEDVCQENVKIVLNNHPDIDMLVGIWDYNAHAIVEVVKERNRRDRTTIVAYDAAPLALADMEDGMIDCLVVQNPYQMGYLGVELMRALILKDNNKLTELYPDYNPEREGFATEDGDIFSTELRVVVPDESSPVTADLFEDNTRFFTYDQFRTWLRERKLSGS